uniref:Putative UDP-glucose/GDP-mannose dehydrogenasese n=1 Tax=viral metagenome TaxID=1070528 RepID=A0A6H1ZGJ8_9ZZZZ
MKALVIGLGQVGAATAWLYQKAGWEVEGYDIDPDVQKKPWPKGDDWGGLDVYVPEKLDKNYDAVAICVPTPVDETHNVEIVRDAFKAHAHRGKWVIIRSTMPVLGCQETFNGNVVYIPEIRPVGYMKTVWPLTLIGINPYDRPPHEVISPYFSVSTVPIIRDYNTIEFAKLAINVYLACSITIANSLDECAVSYGVDYSDIEKVLRADPRIGKGAFVQAGLGFGGSCLPKDLEGFAHDTDNPLFDLLLSTNESHLDNVIKRIELALGGLRGKHLCVLGLAFKPGCDCIVDSRAMALSEGLVGGGAYVFEHDPYVKGSGISNARPEELAELDFDMYILATPHKEYFEMWADLEEGRKFSAWSNQWGCV